MLTLSWVGGSKNPMLTDAYAVVDGGSEIFKRVMMFIKPKSEAPIFENWRKKPQKNTFLNTIDPAGNRNYQKHGI